MNQVQIEIIELQIAERTLACRAHMLRRMVGVPQFRSHPQFFAWAQFVVERFFEADADFGFVAVVARAIEVAVTGSDGGLEEGVRGRLVDLPKAETDGGHFVQGGAAKEAMLIVNSRGWVNRTRREGRRSCYSSRGFWQLQVGLPKRGHFHRAAEKCRREFFRRPWLPFEARQGI